MGGARRDEEKARAKERFFSHRDDFGQWDPKIKGQNYGIYLMGKRILENILELFQLVIGRKWIFGNTITRKNIQFPLYFSHKRDCFIRNGVVMAKRVLLKLSPRRNYQYASTI